MPLNERTPVSGTLKGMIAMAIAILLGGVTAGAAATQLVHRVSLLEQRIGELPTKDDLRAATTRQQAAFVLCPGRRPGTDFVKCTVLGDQP